MVVLRPVGFRSKALLFYNNYHCCRGRLCESIPGRLLGQIPCGLLFDLRLFEGHLISATPGILLMLLVYLNYIHKQQ